MGCQDRDAHTATRVSIGRCDPCRSGFAGQGTHRAPIAAAVARQCDRRCEDRDQEREHDNRGPAHGLPNTHNVLPTGARLRVREHGDLHQDHLWQVQRLARAIVDFALPDQRSIPPTAISGNGLPVRHQDVFHVQREAGAMTSQTQHGNDAARSVYTQSPTRAGR